MIGFYTLDVGEKALVYSLEGHARIEEGPKRMFLWREKVFSLTRHSANQNQYLVTHFHNGYEMHTQGPAVIYQDRTKHSHIHVAAMISLDANEALVVYTQDKDNTKVTRYVKYGPCQFMPEANEWLHEFKWHGTDPNNKTKVIKDGKVFEKLKIIPDQFYYNVDEVRTADDALVRVKLMMFYELVDIEKMLNSTHDPVADFVNCLSADVVNFASQKTYMEFIEQASNLNDLDQYPHLQERCKTIGFEVSKVVFRGYYAHEKLQCLHDTAIDKRSQLKLVYEQEEQAQALIDTKLQSELVRMKQEQEVAIDKLQHQQKMEMEKVKHTLNMEKKQSEDRLQKQLVEHQATLSEQKARDNQELDHLRKLSGMKISLTEYLTGQSKRPVTVTRILANSPAIHLHHSGPGGVQETVS